MNSTKWNSKAIERIVAACAKAGVSKFSYGKLQIDFGPQPITEVTQGFVNLPAPSDQSEASARAQKLEEEDLLEEQLNHLLITDPVAYEKAILERDSDGVRTD